MFVHASRLTHTETDGRHVLDMWLTVNLGTSPGLIQGATASVGGMLGDPRFIADFAVPASLVAL
jgi:hypothetical protein